MSKQIELTQGQVALVDEADFEMLSQFKWYALKHRNTFYAVRNAPTANGKQTRIRMHQLIAGKGIDYIDHIDSNGMNNTRDNLRLATRSQNGYNRGAQANNTSRYKGVSWHKAKSKWQALITFNSKKQHLGYFATAEEAGLAYDAAARELHGEFARLNFNL